jgi:hypothetical protein
MYEMRCDKCRYWEPRIEQEEIQFFIPPLKLGTCSRAMPFWEASEWAGEEIEAKFPETEWREARVMKPEFADRRFFAQDGSDYRAVVLTSGDFFCADFEEVKK